LIIGWSDDHAPLEAENGLVFGDKDEGGDAVCWLGALCPECGAMPSEGTDRCWRCGASPPERSGGRSTQRPSDDERGDRAT
jgi:hypothetical protein